MTCNKDWNEFFKGDFVNQAFKLENLLSLDGQNLAIHMVAVSPLV